MEKKPRKLSEGQRSRLREVLSDYVKQKQSGARVSRSKLLKANPDISPEILAWFKKQQSKSAEAESTTEESAESIDETVLVNGPLAQNAEFGRYRLLSILGEGAMGVVYLAKDTKLGRQVALKVPKRTAIDDDEFMGRFEREAKTAAALSHKNICKVFDAGEYNGMAYITMDFIDGVPLSDLIGTAKLESLDVILTMTGMIAGALQHAHENDILHRDLKPGNIIVNSELAPCVTDFGLARQITSDGATELTHEGTVLGTPAYMAPEQIRGERVNIGPQSDIYSLGVVLFQMLTGQLPFTGSLPEMFAKSLRDNPPFPSKLRQDLPVNVEDLCLKMLKKDPANRFKSMGELQSAIDRVRKKSPPSVASGKEGKAVSTKNFDTTKAKVHALIKKGQYAAATRELNYFSQEDRPEYAELSAWAKETLVKVRKESKALGPKGLKALLQTGREMFQKHDYRGCIQLLSDIPVLYRSDGIEQLLQNATDAEANAEELMIEIKKKERKEEIRGLDRLVKQFLKLKPQNKYARRLSAALQSYGDASAGRHKYSFENGRLVPYEKQTFVGEWLMKGVIVGTLVFAAMFAYVNNYLTSEDDSQNANESPPTAIASSNDGDSAKTNSEANVLDPEPESQPVSNTDSTSILAIAPYSFSEARTYQREAAKQLGVSETVTNSLGMSLKLIPPGKFLMGSPETEADREDDEGPQRVVTISQAVYFQTTEVTKGQWQAAMGTEPWKGWKYNQPGPQYPAVSMNHADAVAFCESLSEKDGHYYRLPTEAEWEHACRAGSTSAWYCGDNVGSLDGHAWWGGFGDGPSKDEHYAHRVQQKRANAFGLYDMCGNVNEWCSDRYQADYYANGPAIDPTGPTIGEKFVVRGGSWVTGLELTRSANRGGSPAQQGRFGLGLRVVREVSSAIPKLADATAANTKTDSTASSVKQLSNSDGLELNPKLTIISQIQGGTKAQLDTWSKKLPQGDRPYWISRRTKGTEVRFDGLARTAPSDREWRIDYLDLEKDAEKYRSLRGGPVTPAIINDSATKTDAHHQILWVKDLPGQVYSNLWGMEGFARDEMLRDFRKPRDMPGPKQFLLPIHISATYDKDIGKISYHMCQALIPYPGVEFQSNLTAAEVREQLPDYFDRNWQLHLLTGIVNSPTQQFAAVFVDRGTSRVPWSVTMNLSAEKYAEALLKIDAIGGWPRCVSSGDYGDGLKFHVVWDNVGNKKLAAVDVVDGS